VGTEGGGREKKTIFSKKNPWGIKVGNKKGKKDSSKLSNSKTTV
jgi:hypothetical protein